MAEVEILDTDKNDGWYFVPRRQEIISVILSGVVFGILVTALSYVLDTFVVQKLFCSGTSAGLCQDTATLSFNISLGLSTVAVIAWLAMQRIFRPALIGLPLVVIFWSLPATTMFAALYDHIFELGLFLSLLGAAVTLSFYWIARLRSFLIIGIIWVLVVALLRWFIV